MKRYTEIEVNCSPEHLAELAERLRIRRDNGDFNPHVVLTDTFKDNERFAIKVACLSLSEMESGNLHE